MAYARAYSYEIIMAIHAEKCSALFLELIPREFALAHGILSQGKSNNSSDNKEESILCLSSTNKAALFNIGVTLKKDTKVTIISNANELHNAINAAYERHQTQQISLKQNTNNDEFYELEAENSESVTQLLQAAESDLLDSHDKAPIVRTVDHIIFQAAQQRASDIHIQPLPQHTIVRQRLDGILDEGITLPLHHHHALVSRIKVMGRMDVAERLIPQDGRCSVRIGNRTVDLRISTIPTTDGERVVIRLLDSQNQLCDFQQLGMPNAIAEKFLNSARKSSGIILVTGPTGSGKTTTLYSTLRELNAPDRNIMTIEDPVEYELTNLGLPISQSQVNEKKGVNFANGLRHILRQDPDIILVGEIRDAETAKIAIQSSLTGHLVFSTLHTNDAPSAITRLIDLGVEPYLVSASLSAVLAQRLVRRICSNCQGSGTITNQDNEEITCDHCHGLGLTGRTGIFELFEITPELRHHIAENASVAALRTEAQKLGMQSLHDAGLQLVKENITSLEELERCIHA